MQKEHSPNLNNIIKNVLLGLCKINVPYDERLDIYGSLHIRADNCDVANFMLNEHFLNSPRAGSPAVTSGCPVDQELAENDNDNVHDGQTSQTNVQSSDIKTEVVVGSLEAYPNGVDLLSGTETATQPQQGSVPQASNTSQSVGSWSSTEVTHASGTVSRYFGETDIKSEISDTATAVHDDRSPTDGVVEILDDDDDDTDNYTENTDYLNNDTRAIPDFKSCLFKTEEDYQTEMRNYNPYSNFNRYDNSNASSPYRYSNASTNYNGQSPVGHSAKRFKPGAYSGGQNVPSSLEKICEYCEERFNSDAQMSAHYLQYHQCPVPQMNSQKRKRKTRVHQIPQEPSVHLSSNAEGNVVQMFKCRFCEQMFRSRDGLHNHENVKHSRTKCYQCSFCSMEFLTRQAAYSHRVNFHRLLVKKSQ